MLPGDQGRDAASFTSLRVDFDVHGGSVYDMFDIFAHNLLEQWEQQKAATGSFSPRGRTLELNTLISMLMMVDWDPDLFFELLPSISPQVSGAAVVLIVSALRRFRQHFLKDSEQSFSRHHVQISLFCDTF